MALRDSEWVISGQIGIGFSNGGQHAVQDLQPKILFVVESRIPPLDDTDFIVEALDEFKSNLVFQPAIGRDSISVPINHRRKLFAVGQALPAERFPQVVEK